MAYWDELMNVGTQEQLQNDRARTGWCVGTLNFQSVAMDRTTFSFRPDHPGVCELSPLMLHGIRGEVICHAGYAESARVPGAFQKIIRSQRFLLSTRSMGSRIVPGP